MTRWLKHKFCKHVTYPVPTYDGDYVDEVEYCGKCHRRIEG